MTARPLLVTGANGNLGRRLLQSLARQEPRIPTRAVVRSERAAATLRNSATAREQPEEVRPEIAIVDYTDADQLARVADGCDAAVHLVGILKQTMANRYEDAHEGPSAALADAARAAGLRRIVALSILGADPAARNACFASRGRAEQTLVAGEVPALVIRVPMVLGSGDPASAALERQARSKRAILVRGGATREQPIAADDVVAAIVAGATREGLDDVVLDLAGPESVSHRVLVEHAAAVLGRQVAIQSLPLGVARVFAFLAERLLADPPLTGAMLGVLEHDDDIDPEPARARLGIELSPLDEALRRAFADAEVGP